MSEEAREYIVTGLVQGVGFRWWCVGVARRLGLRGIVRNLKNGSVQVRAAGSVHALRQLRVVLNQGPPAARVDGVVETLTSADDLPNEFEIAR